MTNLQSIIKKIKALKARAADAASTEAEAILAMQIVEKLLAEHNITMSEVDIKAEGVEKQFYGKTGHMPPESMAWKGIQIACNVKIWNSDGQMAVVGQPSDVEAALYFFDIVKSASIRCYEQYKNTWD